MTSVVGILFREKEKMRVMWNENFDGDKLDKGIQEVTEYLNEENIRNRNMMILELMEVTDFEINDSNQNIEDNRKNYNGTILTNVNNSALNQEIYSMGLSGAFGGFMAVTISASGPFAPLTAAVETAVGIGIDIITTKMSMKKAREKLYMSFNYNKEEYISYYKQEYEKKVEKGYMKLEKELVKDFK